ncbi:MAG: OmpH family outer membrane protein, partial [Ferruginibacter sp.]
MMKNLSVVLNVILLAAVGFLYYYQFSGKKTETVSTKLSNNYMASDSNIHRPPLAYVELDSLNENITFIREKRRELEAEMKKIEQDQENGYRGLQSQKDEFLKRGAAITEQEAQVFQSKLIDQQQKIDARKQELSQKLNERSFSIMEDIQKKLKDFLTEYNKDKHYMYIFTTGT